MGVNWSWKYNIDSDYCRSSEEENKDYVLVKMAMLPKEIYTFGVVPWHFSQN